MGTCTRSPQAYGVSDFTSHLGILVPGVPFVSFEMALLSAGMRFLPLHSQMPLLKRQPGEVERRAWDCGQQQIRRAALDLTQSPSPEP